MPGYFQVTIPLIALMMAVAVQLLVARTVPRWGLVRSFFVGFFAGLVALLALSGLAGSSPDAMPWQETAALLFVNTAIYTALAYCFLAFLSLGVTSIRIRIFSELQQSKHGLSLEELLSLYDYRRIVRLRLERLQRGKQVIVRDGRYFLGGNVLWCVATATQLARWVVMGKRRGS
jgi:hypothetical protein